MPFKPRAQILLQLGEQLIKSESVAILELIKNAYDADATEVTVVMQDIDYPEKGVISITDNGSGMTLDTVCNVWMEPGNTHKKEIVNERERSELGRLPIGEKGIGRFGVHKLGKRIEMITRAKDSGEIVVSINWRAFETAEYLNDVTVLIEEREPVVFKEKMTGTKLVVSDLSVQWTRGMLRKVYRAITSLSSPFDSIDGFRVKVKTNRSAWLDGLMSFNDIKEYALYTAKIEIDGDSITQFNYCFSPFATMVGISSRKFSFESPQKMIQEVRNGKKKELDTIDLNKYKIGKIIIDLMVFDRDSALRARFIRDQKTYGDYLDENGGIRVFRDGVRVYDYGEPGNDWLELDSARINTPGRYISNSLVLGAVRIEREESIDLQEKANREGFIENDAFFCFRNAVKYAINNVFTTQRNIDKDKLRVYLAGGKREPVVADVSEIRKKVSEIVKDEKAKKEIDGYLKRIESDYQYIQNMYLKTASAGMSYGIVIHEIDKIISELNHAVIIESASEKITNLAKHLARLVDSYAELLRNRNKAKNHLKEMINQAIFSLQYRLEAHGVITEVIIDEDAVVTCASNLIVGSIINIIDNSIWWTTYTGVPQKRIVIKATEKYEDRYAIIIADNGCGFALSPEDAIKPFISTKPGGMGLGLNIVNEIMLSQGGILAFPEYGDVELPEIYKNGAIVALVFGRE